MSTHDGESDGLDGGPPIVLVAALATALLIAVGLIAAFSSFGGDDASEPISESAGTTTTTDDTRVLLTVSVEGSGSGQVEITPSDVSCNRSCEYKFTPGRRVVATAQAAYGSTFDGWGDACSGEERCSFVIDQPRTLSATFTEEEPAEAEEEILCEEDVPLDEQDPSCLPDDPDAPSEPREPGPDCLDNIDNDDDGLTDTEQDPDCEATGSEAAGATAPGGAPAPRAPAAQPNECTDRKDNDNDGLTDRAQDPDCESGRSESG